RKEARQGQHETEQDETGQQLVARPLVESRVPQRHQARARQASGGRGEKDQAQLEPRQAGVGGKAEHGGNQMQQIGHWAPLVSSLSIDTPAYFPADSQESGAAERSCKFGMIGPGGPGRSIACRRSDASSSTCGARRIE